jgi:hypothetical protein
LTHYLFTEVDSIDPNVAAVLHRFNSLVRLRHSRRCNRGIFSAVTGGWFTTKPSLWRLPGWCRLPLVIASDI